MEASAIVEKGPMILVGFSFFGDPFHLSGGWTEENEIGRLWMRFATYLEQHRQEIKNVTRFEVMYEVQIEHAETSQTGEYEIFVGVEVDKLEDLPVTLQVKLLPAAMYAVFTLQGAQIASDWSKEMSEWMARNGYQGAQPYGFQRYDERFKSVQQLDESTLDVYVPIKRLDG